MYDYTIETQGLNTYRSYRLPDTAELDTVGIGMLQNNNIRGLIAASFTQIDNTYIVNYNITSKITLKKFFSGVINKERLLGVFGSILDTISEMDEYMLDSCQLLLNLEDVYINVSTVQAEFIYIPVTGQNVGINLPMLFKNILFSVEFNQNENCNYVTKLINYLNKEDAFSIDGFRKQLMQLGQQESTAYSDFRQQSLQQQPFLQQPLQQQAQNASSQQSLSQPSIQPASQMQSSQYISQQSPSQQGYFTQQPAGQPAQAQQILRQPSSQQPAEQPSGLVYQVPEVAGAAAAEPGNKKKGFFGFGKSKSEKAEKPEKQDKKKDKKKDKNTFGAIPVPGMEIPGVTPSGAYINTYSNNYADNASVFQNEAYAGMPKSQQLSRPASESGNFGETTVLSLSGMIGETTVLSPSDASTTVKIRPHLIRKRNGEHITIDSDVFKIGKEPAYVNYCIIDNPVISRSHADIICNGNDYYIVDNNSKNHTYVDGIQIMSQTQIHLKNGSRITLANEEFEFCI